MADAAGSPTHGVSGRIRLIVLVDDKVFLGSTLGADEVRHSLQRALQGILLAHGSPVQEHELLVCCLDERTDLIPKKATLSTVKEQLTSCFKAKGAALLSNQDVQHTSSPDLLTTTVKCLRQTPQQAGRTCIVLVACLLSKAADVTAWDAASSHPALPQPVSTGADVVSNAQEAPASVTLDQHPEHDTAYASAATACKAALAAQLSDMRADMLLIDCGYQGTWRTELADELRAEVTSTSMQEKPTSSKAHVSCVAASEISGLQPQALMCRVTGIPQASADLSLANWLAAHPSMKSATADKLQRMVLHKALPRSTAMDDADGKENVRGSTLTTTKGKVGLGVSSAGVKKLPAAATLRHKNMNNGLAPSLRRAQLAGATVVAPDAKANKQADTGASGPSLAQPTASAGGPAASGSQLTSNTCDASNAMDEVGSLPKPIDKPAGRPAPRPQPPGDPTLDAWQLVQEFDRALYTQDKTAKKKLKQLKAGDTQHKDIAGLKDFFDRKKFYELSQGPIKVLIEGLCRCSLASLHTASKKSAKEMQEAYRQSRELRTMLPAEDFCDESEAERPPLPEELRRPTTLEVLLLLKARYFNSSDSIFQRTFGNAPLRLFRLMRRAFHACHAIKMLGILSSQAVKKDVNKLQKRMESCIQMVQVVVTDYYACRNRVLGPIHERPDGHSCDVPGENFDEDIYPCFEPELPELMQHVHNRYTGVEVEQLEDPQQEMLRGYLALTAEEREAEKRELAGGKWESDDEGDAGRAASGLANGNGHAHEQNGHGSIASGSMDAGSRPSTVSGGGMVRLGEVHSRPRGMPPPQEVLRHRSDIMGGKAHLRPVVQRAAPSQQARPSTAALTAAGSTSIILAGPGGGAARSLAGMQQGVGVGQHVAKRGRLGQQQSVGGSNAGGALANPGVMSLASPPPAQVQPPSAFRDLVIGETPWTDADTAGQGSPSNQGMGHTPVRALFGSPPPVNRVGRLRFSDSGAGEGNQQPPAMQSMDLDEPWVQGKVQGDGGNGHFAPLANRPAIELAQQSPAALQPLMTPTAPTSDACAASARRRGRRAAVTPKCQDKDLLSPAVDQQDIAKEHPSTIQRRSRRLQGTAAEVPPTIDTKVAGRHARQGAGSTPAGDGHPNMQTHDAGAVEPAIEAEGEADMHGANQSTAPHADHDDDQLQVEQQQATRPARRPALPAASDVSQDGGMCSDNDEEVSGNQPSQAYDGAQEIVEIVPGSNEKKIHVLKAPVLELQNIMVSPADIPDALSPARPYKPAATTAGLFMSSHGTSRTAHTTAKAVPGVAAALPGRAAGAAAGSKQQRLNQMKAAATTTATMDLASQSGSQAAATTTQTTKAKSKAAAAAAAAGSEDVCNKATKLRTKSNAVTKRRTQKATALTENKEQVPDTAKSGEATHEHNDEFNGCQQEQDPSPTACTDTLSAREEHVVESCDVAVEMTAHVNYTAQEQQSDQQQQLPTTVATVSHNSGQVQPEAAQQPDDMHVKLAEDAASFLGKLVQAADVAAADAELVDVVDADPLQNDILQPVAIMFCADGDEEDAGHVHADLGQDHDMWDWDAGLRQSAEDCTVEDFDAHMSADQETPTDVDVFLQSKANGHHVSADNDMEAQEIASAEAASLAQTELKILPTNQLGQTPAAPVHDEPASHAHIVVQENVEVAQQVQQDDALPETCDNSPQEHAVQPVDDAPEGPNVVPDNTEHEVADNTSEPQAHDVTVASPGGTLPAIPQPPSCQLPAGNSTPAGQAQAMTPVSANPPTSARQSLFAVPAGSQFGFYSTLISTKKQWSGTANRGSSGRCSDSGHHAITGLDAFSPLCQPIHEQPPVMSDQAMPSQMELPVMPNADGCGMQEVEKDLAVNIGTSEDATDASHTIQVAAQASDLLHATLIDQPAEQQQHGSSLHQPVTMPAAMDEGAGQLDAETTGHCDHGIGESFPCAIQQQDVESIEPEGPMEMNACCDDQTDTATLNEQQMNTQEPINNKPRTASKSSRTPGISLLKQLIEMTEACPMLDEDIKRRPPATPITASTKPQKISKSSAKSQPVSGCRPGLQLTEATKARIATSSKANSITAKAKARVRMAAGKTKTPATLQQQVASPSPSKVSMTARPSTRHSCRVLGNVAAAEQPTVDDATVSTIEPSTRPQPVVKQSKTSSKTQQRHVAPATRPWKGPLSRALRSNMNQQSASRANLQKTLRNRMNKTEHIPPPLDSTPAAGAITDAPVVRSQRRHFTVTEPAAVASAPVAALQATKRATRSVAVINTSPLSTLQTVDSGTLSRHAKPSAKRTKPGDGASLNAPSPAAVRLVGSAIAKIAKGGRAKAAQPTKRVTRSAAQNHAQLLSPETALAKKPGVGSKVAKAPEQKQHIAKVEDEGALNRRSTRSQAGSKTSNSVAQIKEPVPTTQRKRSATASENCQESPAKRVRSLTRGQQAAASIRLRSGAEVQHA